MNITRPSYSSSKNTMRYNLPYMQNILEGLEGEVHLYEDYLRYTNEYILKSEEILDINYFNSRRMENMDNTCMQIIEDFCKNNDIDPSKILLKLCQVCYRTSHKLVPQELSNRKERQVDLLLNNRPILRFRFECSNNKIANRATAFESLLKLFPCVYNRLLLYIKQSTNPISILEYQVKSQLTNQLQVKEKRDKDIYYKLFKCDMRYSPIDKSGKLSGFSCNISFADQSNFRERVKLKMFSTMANSLLQKHAGRSLNFDVKLVKKVNTENSLEGEGRNEYDVNVVDNQGKQYMKITVVCQNKNDAKNICGLKYIELYAYIIFDKIWTIEMPDQTVPPAEFESTLDITGQRETEPQLSVIEYGSIHKKDGIVDIFSDGEDDTNQTYEIANHIEDTFDIKQSVIDLIEDRDTSMKDTNQTSSLFDTTNLCQFIINEQEDKGIYDDERDERNDEVSRSSSFDKNVYSEDDIVDIQNDRNVPEDTFTSLPQMVHDYMEMKYKVDIMGDISMHHVNKDIKMLDSFKGACILSPDFQDCIKGILLHNDIMIDAYVIHRNDSQCEYTIKYLVSKKDRAKSDCFTVRSNSEISFTSKGMNYEQCINFGIFIILERSYPSICNIVSAHTIRKIMSIVDDRICRCTVNNDDDIDNHTSNNSKDKQYSSILSSTNNVTDSFYINNDHMNDSRLVKILDDFYQNNIESDMKTIGDWKYLDTDYHQYFNNKIYTMDKCELISVYYNKEGLDKEKKSNETYECMIKKIDQFYSKIKKIMIEDDYTSVANVFINSIYKEPLDLNLGEVYSIFRLKKKPLIVIKARVSNNKLKKKLSSIIVLRMLWRELYNRCGESMIIA